MELRHLKYFCAVAEELHFGKAARRLHIAQPPLSQQIRNLEAELGLQLFVRANRRIQLTDAGIYFLKEAKQILLHAEQAIETARKVDSRKAGCLSIGFVGSVAHIFLPKVFGLFRERFPEVELVLHELDTSEQLKALHDKRIDIGFFYQAHKDERFNFYPIISEPFIVALPKKHPLSRRKTIDIKELYREPFIALTRSSQPLLRDKFIGMCHAAGFSPVIAQEASHIQTILSIVASGFGICLLPDHIKNIKRPGVLYRPLSGSLFTIELSIVWRSDNVSPLVISFIEVSKEAINQ